jgi:hypothetical protein
MIEEETGEEEVVVDTTDLKEEMVEVVDLLVKTVTIVTDQVFIKINILLGHIARDCPEPPKKRDGSRERGGDRPRYDRGGRGGGRGDYNGGF